MPDTGIAPPDRSCHGRCCSPFWLSRSEPSRTPTPCAIRSCGTTSRAFRTTTRSRACARRRSFATTRRAPSSTSVRDRLPDLGRPQRVRLSRHEPRAPPPRRGAPLQLHVAGRRGPSARARRQPARRGGHDRVHGGGAARGAPGDDRGRRLRVVEVGALVRRSRAGESARLPARVSDESGTRRSAACVDGRRTGGLRPRAHDQGNGRDAAVRAPGVRFAALP